MEQAEEGRWVWCFGLDYLINRDLPEIDRHWLDGISTKHKIFITVQSMHTAFVNSLALKEMEITRDTPDPRDGRIYKDESGEPNGVLTEQTLLLPFMLACLADLGAIPEELVWTQYRAFKEKGITTTWTAGMMSLFPNQIDLMSQWGLRAPIRQDYAVAFNAIENGNIKLGGLPESNDKCKFTGIKFWYDGSPYTGNMFMEDDYLENNTMQNTPVYSGKSGGRASVQTGRIL